MQPDHWGTHRGPDGLLWLLQPTGARNPQGVSEECPLPNPPKTLLCPHGLDLTGPGVDATPLTRLAERHPPIDLILRRGVRAMRILDTHDRRVLVRLFLRLVGARPEAVQPVEAMSRSVLRRLMASTNFCPLVLTGCTPAFFGICRLAYDLAESSPRSVILMGARHLPVSPFTDWDPSPGEVEEAAGLPWDAMGVSVLRNTP